jgi:hypothetical protein
MSKGNRSLLKVLTPALVSLPLLLSGLVLTVSACDACEDLTSHTSLAIGTVAEVTTATTISASTTEPTAAEEPTPTSGSATSETEAPAGPSEPAEPLVELRPAPMVPMGFWTRFEDSDPHVAPAGNWHYRLRSEASGEEYLVSDAFDFGSDYFVVNVSFEGTRISYVAMKGGDCGKAKVTLDGATPVFVDLYAPSLSSEVVWTSPALTSGEHHLRIEWTGTNNAASSGFQITLDALDVIGTLVD